MADQEGCIPHQCGAALPHEELAVYRRLIRCSPCPNIGLPSNDSSPSALGPDPPPTNSGTRRCQHAFRDRSDTAVVCQTVQVRLELGHCATLRRTPTPAGCTHDWRVLVRALEGADSTTLQPYVERVEFHLHQSYRRNKIIVNEPPYSFSESGYGSFVLPVDVYFRSPAEPRRVRFLYDLVLSSSQSVCHVRCEKLSFINPPEPLRTLLIAARGVVTLRKNCTFCSSCSVIGQDISSYTSAYAPTQTQLLSSGDNKVKGESSDSFSDSLIAEKAKNRLFLPGLSRNATSSERDSGFVTNTSSESTGLRCHDSSTLINKSDLAADSLQSNAPQTYRSDLKQVPVEYFSTTRELCARVKEHSDMATAVDKEGNKRRSTGTNPAILTSITRNRFLNTELSRQPPPRRGRPRKSATGPQHLPEPVQRCESGVSKRPANFSDDNSLSEEFSPSRLTSINSTSKLSTVVNLGSGTAISASAVVLRDSSGLQKRPRGRPRKIPRPNDSASAASQSVQCGQVVDAKESLNFSEEDSSSDEYIPGKQSKKSTGKKKITISSRNGYVPVATISIGAHASTYCNQLPKRSRGRPRKIKQPTNFASSLRDPSSDRNSDITHANKLQERDHQRVSPLQTHHPGRPDNQPHGRLPKGSAMVRDAEKFLNLQSFIEAGPSAGTRHGLQRRLGFYEEPPLVEDDEDDVIFLETSSTEYNHPNGSNSKQKCNEKSDSANKTCKQSAISVENCDAKNVGKQSGLKDAYPAESRLASKNKREISPQFESLTEQLSASNPKKISSVSQAKDPGYKVCKSVLKSSPNKFSKLKKGGARSKTLLLNSSFNKPASYKWPIAAFRPLRKRARRDVNRDRNDDVMTNNGSNLSVERSSLSVRSEATHTPMTSSQENACSVIKSKSAPHIPSKSILSNALRSIGDPYKNIKIEPDLNVEDEIEIEHEKKKLVDRPLRQKTAVKTERLETPSNQAPGLHHQMSEASSSTVPLNDVASFSEDTQTDSDVTQSLDELKKRLESTSDFTILRKVIGIIHESGNVYCTDASQTFDFDLNALDMETIRRLNLCLQSSAY